MHLYTGTEPEALLFGSDQVAEHSGCSSQQFFATPVYS